MNVSYWYQKDSPLVYDKREPKFKLGVRPKDRKKYVARLQEMKERRPAVSKTVSLKELSKNCIIANLSRFMTIDTIFKGHINNPFACLPEELAQDLMNETRLLNFLDGKSGRLCLWTNMSEESQAIIFRHLLQNCPNIQQIDVTRHIYEDDVCLPRSRPVDIFQIMGQQWPNLTFLEMTAVPREHEDNSDLLFEMISRHLPALSELEIVLSVETLTMEGVKHLSQMNKLKYLGVVLEDCSKDHSFLLIVLAVGELPSIEKFSIINSNPCDRHYNHFVDAFGRLYPRKRLILTSLRIAYDLKNTWPECLTLENLYIDESSARINDKSDLGSITKYKNLLAGKCFPTKVCIKGVESDGIYPLVEKFGSSGLLDLTIRAKFNKEPLDVCRVIAACPKLQNIKIRSKDFTENSEFKVTPDHFQELESFCVSLEEDNFSEQVSKLYRNYLIGSRKFLKRLTLKETEEFDDVLWALDQERRTCLDQAEEVFFHETLSFNFSEDGQIQKDALMLALQLALRSPNLKKVNLGYICDFELPPKWYQEAFKDLGILLTVNGARERSESSDDDQDVCSEQITPFPEAPSK